MLPTVEHLFYIPAILLVGLVSGFILGVRSARRELVKREEERKR